jgi:hypothetical protein
MAQETLGFAQDTRMDRRKSPPPRPSPSKERRLRFDAPAAAVRRPWLLHFRRDTDAGDQRRAA